MCLMKTDPVFSVPSWSYLFFFVEWKPNPPLALPRSVSLCDVGWIHFLGKQSGSAFSVPVSNGVHPDSKKDFETENSTGSWLHKSFLDSRRRGHSIFSLPKTDRSSAQTCGDCMWKIDILVNSHITMENHYFWWENSLFLWRQQATVPQKNGESTHNQTQLCIRIIRIQLSLEPKIDETPMLSSRLLVSPQQSPTSAGCRDGRLPSLKSHRDINNRCVYICIYIHRDSVLCWKKRTIILQASKILQIMIGFIPIS